MSRQRLAVLTTGRQDYGILRSTLLLLRSHPKFDLRLWAGGMHLEERFGRTLTQIAADGLVVHSELPFLGRAAAPHEVASAAMTVMGRVLAEESPDALMLLGDRVETLVAAVAATLARVPVVHLHGGEETEGAIDNACRHALTKLSHLHLVSHALHADRVIQMGEDPAAVVVVGAPGLDNRYRDDLPGLDAIERQIGIPLRTPLILVTVHPTTLGGRPLAEVEAVAAALERVSASSVITQPNSDEGAASIRDFWLRWQAGRQGVAVVDALGEAAYWALLNQADVVVGNSSSGIIEAPAAGVPVVNVGDRQLGRMRDGRVWDVPADPISVTRALRQALAAGRDEEGASSGYPSGPAAPRIIAALEHWKVPVPPRKRFHSLTCPTA